MLTLGISLGTGPHARYSSTTLQGGADASPTSATQAISGMLGAHNAFAYGLNASYNNGGGMRSNSLVGANASYTSPLTTVNGNVSRSAHYTQGSVGVTVGR